MIRIKSILVAVLLISFMSAVSAQTAKFEIDLKKIEIRNNVQSPSFPDQIDTSGSKPPQNWTILFVHYEIKFDNPKKTALDDGKWLNTLQVDWEFLYKPEKLRNDIRNFVRFGKTVKYANVGEGKHTALMFIDPKILKRYFNEGRTIKNELMMRLSIKANGLKQVVKIANKKFSQVYFKGGKILKTPTKTDLAMFDSDLSKELPNVVRPRNETPFRSIQFDQFNTIVVEDK